MIEWNYIIQLDFLPPSSNHTYFRSNNKRMFMSKEGHVFKESVGWIARKCEPIKGEVEVDVTFYFPDKRRRDAQNLEKLTWDSLEGYCYLDDKQIAERHVHRKYGDAKTIIKIRPFKELS